MEILVSVPPTAPFLRDLARVTAIQGFRFNTGLPVEGDFHDHLASFAGIVGTGRCWVDLKTREIKLRGETRLSPGSTVLEVNHAIEGTCPLALYYNEGAGVLEIERISNGNLLHVHLPGDVPDDFCITFGKGASFNIPDARVVDDPITERDVTFVHAAMKAGIHQYCVSYVEETSDIESIMIIDPQATIIAKIESKRGLEFARHAYQNLAARDRVRLMAARGDLYIELDKPHELLGAMKIIITADPRAIGASRILLSMRDADQIPSCADVCDVGFMKELGYHAFLLGDEISEDEHAIKSAIGMLLAIDTAWVNGLS